MSGKRTLSLSQKTVVMILILTAVIGVTSVIFAFFLNRFAVEKENELNTWALARTLSAQLDETKVNAKTEEILDIYDALPVSEKDEQLSKEARRMFQTTIDEDFYEIQDQMDDLRKQSTLYSTFIAALDPDTNRMIYLIDSDETESFCFPGTWDIYSADNIDRLINGIRPNKLERTFGVKENVQAIVSDLKQYGVRCTGAQTLYTKGKYTVVLCVDNSIEEVVNMSRMFLVLFILLLLIVAAITSALIVRRLRARVIKPINQMAEAARAYTEDRNSKTRHFEHLQIDAGDEIAHLSNTMKEMESEIAEYIENIRRITAEEERINTELDLAGRIQSGAVHEKFPVYPDRKEFDVYATMIPAKQVGGDFYDIFLIDDDHLAVLIADVAGKGVPAALLMMAVKIKINDYAIMEKDSPAGILEYINEQICSSNFAEMFVTVWLGILEISTGKLTAANAGHEYPIIRRAGGRFELMKDTHSFILGGMEDMKYMEYELELQPGDMIFQYTDGVTEATDREMKLFGTDLLIETLNSADINSAKDTADIVYDRIEEFVKESPQFDDITMLCMKYNGKDDTADS